MATLDFERVKKSYESVEVLHDINLSIEKGQFVVIVGPSGCGKSSLLRMVAGLESITSGKISINGQCVNQIRPAKRDIAMVFQNYALYPHMSVYKNMAYALKLRGEKKSDINRKVSEVAELLRLSDYLERKPSELSGGQRQRVAMGRAIVRKPSVFLFDEPLSNLDAKLRQEMRIEIKRLQRTLNITSMYVTHDQTEAMTMADKLVVLNNGYIEQQGSPLEVYDKPQSMFVAEFMGNSTMNFLPLDCLPESDFEQVGALKKTRLDEVIAGVRPEHWLACHEGHGLTVDIDLCEMLGSDKIIYGVCRQTKHKICARLAVDTIIDSDNTICIKPKLNKIILFDKDTGCAWR